MKLKKWLTVSSNGSARLTASKPDLTAKEISINMEINLPDALFEKPKLVASITVPDSAANSNIIESIVYDNVKEAVEKATGLEFSISIVNPDNESA